MAQPCAGEGLGARWDLAGDGVGVRDGVCTGMRVGVMISESEFCFCRENGKARSRVDGKRRSAELCKGPYSHRKHRVHAARRNHISSTRS